MAIAPMKKIGVAGYRPLLPDVLAALSDIGAVQIVAHHDETKTGDATHEKALVAQPKQHEPVHNAARYAAELLRATQLLNEIGGKQPPPDVTIERFRETVEKTDVATALATIFNTKSELDEKRRKLSATERRIKDIEPYLAIGHSLSEMHRLKTVKVFLGNISGNSQNELHGQMEKLAPLVELYDISATPKEAYILLFAHNSIADKALESLRSCEFTGIDAESARHVPAKYHRMLLEEKDALTKEIERLSASLFEIARRDMTDLLILLEHYRTQARIEAASGMAELSRKGFLLSGWIKVREYESFKERLGKKTDLVEIFELAPSEDEEPPVALDNPKFLQPFELLTNLYGKPRKGMIDPTPWMGPFFAVFFAFCLTDAGYGLIVTVFCALVLIIKRKRMKLAQKNFFTLFLYLGIATVGAGAVAGSWFGLLPAKMDQANPLVHFLSSVQLFDTLDDALLFFAITVMFGMVHLAVGFAISTIIKVREAGKIMEKLHLGVLGLAWVMISIGLGLFISDNLIPEKIAPLMPFTMLMLKGGVGGILVGWLVLGPLSGVSIGTSIVQTIGFDGAYGIIGVFGDTLSYARILALGISTGVIAGVINQLAGMLMAGGIAMSFIAIIILVVAHVGYTAMSCLSAFIHPLRLQYVEFFGKFYESGYNNFEPFSTEYTEIELIETK